MEGASSSSSSYAKGEMVAVRCNQHKWLLGEVKRVSGARGGVRVWVADASLLVNVPRQLMSSHLLKMSSMDEALHSLPPAESMLATATRTPDDRFLVSCVRPAHLSHRLLYLSPSSSSKSSLSSSPTSSSPSDCAICGQALIAEDDEAVAPWDCFHHCHIDCIQDKPHFFSTTTCPICSTSSQVPNNNNKLHTIQEHKPAPSQIKPAITRKHTSVTFHDLNKDVESDSNRVEAVAASTSRSMSSSSPKKILSLAERMKKFSMPIIPAANCDQQHVSAAVNDPPQWLTVIKDGQDTRETDARLEHMAKAKENTFSAKAAKMKNAT